MTVGGCGEMRERAQVCKREQFADVLTLALQLPVDRRGEGRQNCASPRIGVEVAPVIFNYGVVVLRIAQEL